MINRVARTAVLAGAVMHHGFKHRKQLQSLLSGHGAQRTEGLENRTAPSFASKLNSLIYWELCQKYSAGVAHVHFGFNALEWIPVKRILGERFRLIVSLLGTDLTDFPASNKHVYDELFLVADAFLVSSLFLKNIAVNLGCREDKITVHPVEVDTSVFKPAGAESKDRSKLTILSTGRLVQKKGYETALKAIARLKQLKPELQFRYKIIGGGPLEHQIVKQAEELGLSQDIVMLGQQSHDQVRQQMQQSDVFFMPSVMEELGGSSLEASACELPVIASRVGGLPEAVINDETGLLASPGDAEAFASLLVLVLENPQLSSQLGRNGRRHVESHFEAEHLYTQLPRHYWPNQYCHEVLP